MKFKEIKPGMVIHCPKEEDAKVLMKHLFNSDYDLHQTDTTHKYFRIEPNNFAVSSLGGFYSDEITEFSDLIEPETTFKVGDEVRVRKDLETGKKYKGVELLKGMGKYRGKCGTISEITKSGNYYLDETGYFWAQEMLEPAPEPVNDSPINSDADSPMTAKELLEWLQENGDDMAGLQTVFGEDCFDYDDVLELRPQVIIDSITAYEAKKKKPKPVEVESGWYLEILKIGEWGAMETVDQREMWEVNQEVAMSAAMERAGQYTSENGVHAYFRVCGICRVKEGEA